MRHKWLKTEFDTIERKVLEASGRVFRVFSVSRHRKTGEIQGYIVLVTSKCKQRIYFKHYKYRSVAVDSAIGDYILWA